MSSPSSTFLLQHFDRLAEAPGGIAKLRALVLQLGVQGKLLPQDLRDEPAAKLIERVQAEKKRMRAAKVIPPEKEHPAFEDGELPFPIPDSWSWQRLSAITHTFGQKVPDQRFTYIDVGAIDNRRGLISEPAVLEAADAPSRARKIVRKGAVIYSTVRPYLLNTCVIATDFKPEPIASTAFAVLNPHADISAHYLHFYLRSQPFISYVENRMKGQAYPAINDGDMSVAPIPLPPLPEQRRIVAKVEELMALCEALEAAQREREAVRTRLRTSALHQLASAESDPTSAAFVLQNLPRLTTEPEDLADIQQSVLQLAIQGRLVSSNAEKSSSVAESDDESFSVPHSWSWEPISTVGQTQTGSTPPTAERDHYAGEIPFIKPAAINEARGEVVYTGEGLTKSGANESTLVEAGTILMVCIGGSIGKAAVVDRPACFNQQINSVTPRRGVDSRYVLLAMRSPYFRSCVLDTAAQGTLPIISKGKWERLKIPLPPLAEQRRIVAKVDELMAVLDALEAALTATRGTSEKLLAATVAGLHVA